MNRKRSQFVRLFLCNEFVSIDNPLIDRKIRGSILLMGKLNAYQKRQILISFSIQTLSHTFINNLNCRSLANKNAFSIFIIYCHLMSVYWNFAVQSIKLKLLTNIKFKSLKDDPSTHFVSDHLRVKIF